MRTTLAHAWWTAARWLAHARAALPGSPAWPPPGGPGTASAPPPGGLQAPGEGGVEPPVEPPPGVRAVVLVSLDGVRWQEAFGGTEPVAARRAGLRPGEHLTGAGLMPHLHRHFLGGGAVVGAPGVGAPVRSPPAAVSLPGYLELLSGRREEVARDNEAPRTRSPTLLDQAHRRPGGRPHDVAALTSWHVIERAASVDPRSFPMSFGRHLGLTRHRAAADEASRALLAASARRSAFPGHGDYRADPATAALALAYRRVHRPTLLYVGLGDVDEYGHLGDYRDYLRSIQRSDAFLGALMESLAATGDAATTTVLVTTDHGRDADDFRHHGVNHPTSREVWVAAAGAAVTPRGAVAAPRERRLADVAPTVRWLLGLPPDRHPLAGEVLTELFDGLDARKRAARAGAATPLAPRAEHGGGRVVSRLARAPPRPRSARPTPRSPLTPRAQLTPRSRFPQPRSARFPAPKRSIPRTEALDSPRTPCGGQGGSPPLRGRLAPWSFSPGPSAPCRGRRARGRSG